MQVLASQRSMAGVPSRTQVWSALTVGIALLSVALVVLFLVFVAGFLDRFTPSGRATTYQLVTGALAWAFALTAPAAAGLGGLMRLMTGIERQRARRPRITPAVRLARTA